MSSSVPSQSEKKGYEKAGCLQTRKMPTDQNDTDTDGNTTRTTTATRLLDRDTTETPNRDTTENEHQPKRRDTHEDTDCR